MKTALAIFRNDTNIADIQDFNRRAMGRNWNWGVFEWQSPLQIPFITPVVNAISGNAVTKYEYRRIEIVNGVKTYKGTTYDYKLTAGDIKTDVGALIKERYYSDASKTMGSFVTGLYELYLKDDEGNIFMSNPVWIENTCNAYVADESDYDKLDYDPTDFATD